LQHPPRFTQRNGGANLAAKKLQGNARQSTIPAPRLAARLSLGGSAAHPTQVVVNSDEKKVA
jgi:hypothetical protein